VISISDGKLVAMSYRATSVRFVDVSEQIRRTGKTYCVGDIKLLLVSFGRKPSVRGPSEGVLFRACFVPCKEK